MPARPLQLAGLSLLLFILICAACGEPASTPTPAATSTAIPTATATPTATPKLTPTSTAIPTPTEAPKPTPTVEALIKEEIIEKIDGVVDFLETLHEYAETGDLSVLDPETRERVEFVRPMLPNLRFDTVITIYGGTKSGEYVITSDSFLGVKETLSQDFLTPEAQQTALENLEQLWKSRLTNSLADEQGRSAPGPDDKDWTLADMDKYDPQRLLLPPKGEAKIWGVSLIKQKAAIETIEIIYGVKALDIVE